MIFILVEPPWVSPSLEWIFQRFHFSKVANVIQSSTNFGDYPHFPQSLFRESEYMSIHDRVSFQDRQRFKKSSLSYQLRQKKIVWLIVFYSLLICMSESLKTDVLGDYFEYLFYKLVFWLKSIISKIRKLFNFLSLKADLEMTKW